MSLLSRQVYRTFLSPSALSSAERRWLRAVGITTNVVIIVAILAAVTMFIIVTDRDVAAWFWENIFARPWWPMPPTPK